LVTRLQAEPVYFYNGAKYASLDELKAAVAKNDGVAFVQSPIKDANPGLGSGSKQWQLAAMGAKGYLQRINSLLRDTQRLKQLVHSLFVQYAGADQRLQQHEALWLMESLGAQIGFSNPAQTFGEIRHMFYRFDFSGTGELEEAECEHLVKFILRKARDRLSPHTGVKQCHLPQKRLEASYDIIRQLGQGAQGAVYLTREKTREGKERVLKFYSKADTISPLDDIKEEFMLLRQLDHPMIARVLDIFEDTVNIYVVAEPYFGGDLTTLVSKAREHGVTPTVEWIGRVFRQVLEGLTYLHSQMVMHCDMKEPNIMVAHDSEWTAPHVVIIDFGMAKDFSGAREGGTPGYMPPEVWQTSLWTPKGDVFSLAATFWAVLNGGRGGPFLVPDAPPYSRIMMLTCQQPMDLSRFPVGLRELTDKMASKDFHARPPARECLRHPFFQHLSQHQAPLDPVALNALRQASEKRSIQNLVAMDLMSSENLGQLRHLNELFQRLDLDNDGTVELEEARKVFAELHMEQTQAERLISALVGEKGVVHYSEFMAKLFLAQRGVKEEQLAALFASIDTDNSGTLDISEIEALLARPNMAQIMEGRTAQDIMNELDRDGNGVIDFSEFSRAMLGDSKPSMAAPSRSWAEGDPGRYFSMSNNMWLPCKIVAVDQASGAVMVDVKHGYWISMEEQRSLLVRGRRQWQVGDACRYFSHSHNQFVSCRIHAVNPDGGVMVDVKPGCWLPAWAVTEVEGRSGSHLAQGNSTARVRHETLTGDDKDACSRRATVGQGLESVDLQPLRPSKAWAVGDRGKYYSKRQGAWFDCIISALDLRGAVQLNVKPDYWMLPAEQAEVLRR